MVSSRSQSDLTSVKDNSGDVGCRAARAHAEAGGLEIDYRVSTAEALEATETPRFDVILNMEVIEHVADPGEFLRTCARLLAPGGDDGLLEFGAHAVGTGLETIVGFAPVAFVVGGKGPRRRLPLCGRRGRRTRCLCGDDGRWGG